HIAERARQWDEVQHVAHVRPAVFLAPFTAVVAAVLRGEDDEAVRHVRIKAEAGPRGQLAELTVAAAAVDDERELLAGRVLRRAGRLLDEGAIAARLGLRSHMRSVQQHDDDCEQESGCAHACFSRDAQVSSPALARSHLPPTCWYRSGERCLAPAYLYPRCMS